MEAEGLRAFSRNHNISDPRAGGIRKCAEARLPSHNKAGKATPAARLSGAAPGPPARPRLLTRSEEGSGSGGTRGQVGTTVKMGQERAGVRGPPFRAGRRAASGPCRDPRLGSRKPWPRPPVRLPSPSAAPGARPACASLSTPITYNGIVSGAGTAQSLPPRDRRRRCRPGHDPPRREGRGPASAPGPTQSRTRAPPL